MTKSGSQDNSSTSTYLPIPGYEGRYLASNLGTIAYDNHLSQDVDPDPVAVRLSTSGYPKVRLTDDAGVRTAWLVHHLIYLTFNGPLPPRGSDKSEAAINHPLYGMVVMHLDDIHENNFPHNLQLGTQRENRKMIGRARAFRDMSDAELRAIGR